MANTYIHSYRGTKILRPKLVISLHQRAVDIKFKFYHLNTSMASQYR